MYKGSSVKLNADFSSETMGDRKQQDGIFKMLKEKKVNQDFYIQQNNL